MGRSLGAGESKWSRSSTSVTSTDMPSGLTSTPGFAHFFYMLTVYRYMLLCFLFGLLSVILGVSMLSMFLVLRSKTSSMQLLESVPLYMPGLILICNGASMIGFMYKHTRRFYLLKSVCGLFLLVALLLIIVTVTTSVIHIPRLHSHRECAYTERLRACTCVQNSISSSIASKHFIMEDIDSCEIVHGIVYDSLRVVFALSLVAILISVFSIMTLYQLYIHEKQKAYFSQLNTLRHRIHQRNVMQNRDLGDTQSNYLDHFNHLYSVDGATAAEGTFLPQVKCLSAEFSSQDLLIDQSSTNFGVSNPKDQANLSSRGRIWSSQLSNFAQASDKRSESANLNKPLKTVSMRRYMSVIFDRSSNVQSYVRHKLNSLRRVNSSQRMDKRHYSKVSKSQLLPPHVTIPRYSQNGANMAQSSIESTIINFSTERTTPSELLRKSVSMQSSSSSHRSTSTSSTSAKSKLPQQSKSFKSNPAKPPTHLHLAQANYSRYNQHTERKRSSELSMPSNEQSYNRTSHESSGSNYESVHMRSIEESGYRYGSWQGKSSKGAPNWSHSSVMDTFKCIDEDDLINSQHFLLEHNSQATRFGPSYESAICMESKPLRYEVHEHCLPNTSPSGSAEEVVSITPVPNSSNKFTFVSQLDNRQYMTTFEEAFKNYYDSQHRISSQNSQNGHYYTMPIKSTKEHRFKRKHGCLSRPERTVEPERLDEQQPVFRMEPAPEMAIMMACQQNEPSYHPIYCQQQVNDKTHNAKDDQNLRGEAHYMSEDEFPAIEPPADYKNVATIEEIVPNESKTRTMETLMTNQLMQPYQIWVQQFIEQMNAMNYTQLGDTAKIYNPGSMEGYATNGFVDDDDDDGAGDTSTSQDIADFELELDEEPIKFVDDEEYKAKLETREPAQQPAAGRIAFKALNCVMPTGLDGGLEQLNLLKKNTDLIKRAVQMNKATADYGFDGFRKGVRGCFADDDSSSTSSDEESLSNGSSDSSNSITAEYIKPPTPFTNNFFVNN